MSVDNGSAKYRTAAAVVEHALRQAAAVAVPGMSIAAICRYADSLVEAACGSVFRKEEGIERGVAFPTTVSVNRIIQNCSPGPDEDYILREGDVAKIDVGAHIDGHIAAAAHTTVATDSPSVAVAGRRADAICAAYYASEVAVRMIRPGQSARNMVKALGLVASGFGCTVAADTFTSQIDRFVVGGRNTFANRFNPNVPVPDLTFEAGEVYTVDCTLSTGSGVARESTHSPALYQRDVNQQYSLKLRTSRALFTEVCRQHSVFPFLMRDVVGANQSLKAGVSECVRAQLLVPFAVTMDKEPGDTFVAQFKATVLCHHTGPVRLTRALPMSAAQSAVTIPPESEIGQILALDCEQATLPELPRTRTQIRAPLPTRQPAAASNPVTMDTS